LELWTVWNRTGPPIDKSVSQRMWRTRQIGFLFSKQPNFWVVFVLVAPMSVNQKEEQYKFCYRDSSFSGSAYSFIQSDLPLRDMIAKIKIRLRDQGHRYVKRVLWDVLWGWERYIAQVKADITGVYYFLKSLFLCFLIVRSWRNPDKVGGMI
jgi:hypothetical protein